MPLVPMKQLLNEATKGGYGVGAFNVNNMEQIQAIMEACSETQSPVIIQASKGALEYSNLVYLKKLMEAALIENPEIPIVMHLDHGSSLDWCKRAIELGFTSVMIDASLEEDGKTIASSRFGDISLQARFLLLSGFDLGDLELLLGAARGRDLDDLVHLASDERRADRRLARKLAAFEIGLGRSHDLELARRAGVLVLDVHDRAESDLSGVSAALFDHGRTAEPLFEQRDLLFDLGLLVLGVVVFGVLCDITEVAGLTDALGYVATAHGCEVLDLFLELFQTFRGNFRLAAHWHQPLLGSPGKLLPAQQITP